MVNVINEWIDTRACVQVHTAAHTHTPHHDNKQPATEGGITTIKWGIIFGMIPSEHEDFMILTNLTNEGLISADRKTSLLSCLQYPI